MGFDFETPGDHSRAIALFLTACPGKFSGLIQGHIPIDVAEANESQSGKDLPRQKLIAAAYNHDMAKKRARLFMLLPNPPPRWDSAQNTQWRIKAVLQRLQPIVPLNDYRKPKDCANIG